MINGIKTKMTDKNKNDWIVHEVDNISTFISVAALGAGAYHGYCHAHGIPIEKKNLEFLLKYGPAIAGAAIDSVLMGVAGAIGGGMLAETHSYVHENKIATKIAKIAGGAVAGTAAGAVAGGVFGGGVKLVQTLIGYGIGYGVGYILK